jgi:peptide-methionine (S)-S-oxide reductase
MSAIFYHNKHQQDLANKTKEEQGKRRNRPIATVIEPAAEFYVAEDYHQKFLLRKHPELMKHIKYSTTKELVDSTVASKLNGYVGGYGSLALLEKEIADFNLPSYAADKLRKIVDTTEPDEC